MLPVVAVPGRRSERADGLRTEVVAAGRRYLEALRRAGAEGLVLLPSAAGVDRLPDLLGRVDGLLLLGGGDVDPTCYGASSRHETVHGVDEAHDAFELAAVRMAIDRGLPVLAVCRGFQVLNVALGGTLHQHITDRETTVAHRLAPHPIELTPGCRTAVAMRTTRPVGHSVHHQAVDRLGDGLVVTGRTADGVVEAAELTTGWVVGVQWHPEDTAADDPANQGLFDAFANQARLHAARR
jgi:putative glutamine amidotransferase